MNLNKNMTFENFISGKSNKFAYKSSLTVANEIGKILYNPLFIYGKKGIGKTHLLNAIGNYIIDSTDKKVLYISADEFILDFVNINTHDKNENNDNNIDSFKNKYHNIDVLIIDDIQFLGGMTHTQQEFFNIFNSLYNDDKQIIISSDRPPEDLKLIENSLRDRLCWGLAINIDTPNTELCIDILKSYVAEEKFEINILDEVIEYIATNFSGNIRQLKEAITRLIAYSAITKVEEITLDVAIEALKD